MRAINSAVCLAGRTGHQLRIVWEKVEGVDDVAASGSIAEGKLHPWHQPDKFQADLASEFGDLFVVPSEVEVIETIPYRCNLKCFWRLDLLRFHPREYCRKVFRTVVGLFQDQQFDLVLGNDEIEEILKTGWDFETVSNSKRVLLFSGSQFLGGPFHGELFVPVDHLQERIRAVTSDFGSSTVGVHIRRQDNTWAIENSPERLFVREMNRLVVDNADTVFFLATDCGETEQRMRERFPGQILSSNPERVRSTRAGIQDAVVDMYCLARTQHILGSHWSSFGRMAGALGGVKMSIMKEDGN